MWPKVLRVVTAQSFRLGLFLKSIFFPMPIFEKCTLTSLRIFLFKICLTTLFKTQFSIQSIKIYKELNFRKLIYIHLSVIKIFYLTKISYTKYLDRFWNGWTIDFLCLMVIAFHGYIIHLESVWSIPASSLYSYVLE